MWYEYIMPSLLRQLPNQEKDNKIWTYAYKIKAYYKMHTQ